MNQLLSYPDSKTTTGKRDIAILELFYSTGIRLSELINLNTADLNRDEGVMKVKGKGRKERIVPVGRKAWGALDAYIQTRTELPLLSRTLQGERPLFVNEKGKRLYPQAIGRMVRKCIGAVSEIEKRSPHVLRHTFAHTYAQSRSRCACCQGVARS